jgi:hypothetical protein
MATVRVSRFSTLPSTSSVVAGLGVVCAKALVCVAGATIASKTPNHTRLCMIVRGYTL